VGSIDATTWQAVGVTLTVVGLLLSLLMWRRRGPAAGLRGIAWSLLPAAAGLTGTLKLLWDIGDEVLRWATRLVFNPVVWAGITLLGCSLVLFALTAAMRARHAGRGTAERKPLPRERSSKPAAPAAPAGQDGVDGMDDDIEAILRKHGIS
jgi:uncharacterized protein (TIGR03382 family)